MNLFKPFQFNFETVALYSSSECNTKGKKKLFFMPLGVNVIKMK